MSHVMIKHVSVIAKIISGEPDICAGQNVGEAINALPDILSPSHTFFPVDWEILVVILVFLVGHFMLVEPFWTKMSGKV